MSYKNAERTMVSQTRQYATIIPVLRYVKRNPGVRNSIIYLRKLWQEMMLWI